MKRKNFCMAGHASAGKTSLGEALLYKTGASNRLGSTDEGNSVLDYMNYEKDRKYTVSLSAASFEYEDLMIDLIDTPGYLDFQADLISGMSVTDAALIVVDGSSGIEFTTEKVIELANERNLPKFFYVSKIDKENGNFNRVLEEIKEEMGDGVLPLAIPFEEDGEVRGLVDLVEMKGYDSEGEVEIPSSAEGKVKEYREKMIEGLAEVNMELMEKFIEEVEISDEDIRSGLKEGFINGDVYPVLPGNSLSLLGTDLMLKYIHKIFPEPEEASLPEEIESVDGPPVAYVFKTKFEPHVGELNFVRIWRGTVKSGENLLNTNTGTEEKINQMFRMQGKERNSMDELMTGSIGVFVKLKDTETSHTLADPDNPVTLPEIDFPSPVAKIAIKSSDEKESERIAKGLSKIKRTDPTLNFDFDSETKQLIVESMGEQHLQFMKFWLEDEFDVSIQEEKPGIHYRETIQSKAEGHARFKKQTGGRGQYGEVYLKVEPLDRGEGVEFEDQIKGGNIPSKFIPSVETGVTESAQQGILAGYPIIDFKVIVYDGSHHPVDSSDNAFKRAGSMALRDAIPKSNPYLLEPVLKIQVIIPDEYTGDVMGDLNSRRGRILGIEAEGKFKKINAYVPEKEMFKYSSTLRSITQGTGTYTSEFAFYQRVPEDVAGEIIKESKREEED